VSTPRGRFRAPSFSGSSQSDYSSTEEVEHLLTVLSPHNSNTHTPEGRFESLTTQMTTQMATMDVKETGMPGGMKSSEGKGKQPEPPREPSPKRRHEPSFFSQDFGERSGGGGGGGPNPGAGTAPAVYPPAPSKKRHIQKPANFIDPKDWDKFRRQEFLYYEEYEDDFVDDASRIRFNLSFFTEGLPEKFTANYLDRRMNQAVPTWGSFGDFQRECNAAFQDTNKKTNAENQLMLLKQGSKTAEEFFQELDQLKFTAGYTDRHHEDVLVKLLHDAIKNTTIDHIYTQSPLPASYQTWKTQILAIDGLQRRRAEQKKSQAHFTINKPAQHFVKRPDAPVTQTKTGTGTVYGGQGQKMDLDKAKAEGLCFRCGGKGHMSRNCPTKGTQVRAVVIKDDDKKQEDFQETQQ
jgi:hypothetical protein